MPERHIVANLSPDPKQPAFTLARIFSQKVPGAKLDKQPPQEDNLYHGAIHLVVEEEQKDDVQRTWIEITSTNDFQFLQRACEGDVAISASEEYKAADFILPNNEASFWRFNNFLIRYSYQQAIIKAEVQEDFLQVKKLKLDARQAWAPKLSSIQRILAPYYIQSVVERLHNLVTNGEERKTFKDSVLDWMMG